MKKRILSILLAALMIVSLLPTVAFAATVDYAESGSGTISDPYIIETMGQLEAFATMVSNGT